MRYGIFSDIHSNLEALEAVIAAYKKESIDTYLCVGDIVGYASNPNECSSSISSLAQNSVAGNHDWASLGLLPTDYFNPAAAEAVSWTRARLNESSISLLKALPLVYKNEDLTLVHGTVKEPREFDYLTECSISEETFGLLENNICFVGHTHIPLIFIQDASGCFRRSVSFKVRVERGNKYIVNVGSVGQPRDGNPQAAYCIYDTESRDVTVKRAEYDAGSARNKIISSGLPPFLGERLLAGR